VRRVSIQTFVRGLTVAQYKPHWQQYRYPTFESRFARSHPPGSTGNRSIALLRSKYDILSPLQRILRRLFPAAGSSNKYRDDKKHRFLNMRQADRQSPVMSISTEMPNGWASFEWTSS